MIRTTIEKIESRIQNSGGINTEQKQDLLGLMGSLKSEILELSKTNAEQAHSVAGFTDVTTHEATREQVNHTLLKTSLDGLSYSVKEFEISHPQLVEVVNTICVRLSNMGI
ncbi:MAG TPA: DUF4404 family protein [Verrucomicrobiales bacterium]|nr:DUF4404 family protein [Verrucomicrobiales bacterium]